MNPLAVIGRIFLNFLASVKSRDKCICDIETGHTSTVVCHLGNISYKLNRKLYWDAAAGAFRDNDEANRLVRAEYHNGWRLN